MLDLLAYSPSQFIMISPEVLQDLHARYFDDFWPWLLVFVAFNGLVLFKQYQRITFFYLALSWLFIASFYFSNYLAEVHTFASFMTGLFAVQAVLLIILKPVPARLQIANRPVNIPQPVRHLGLIIYIISAAIPFSLLLQNSKGVVLLFGWGAEQTALGTIGLTIYCLKHKRELLLLIVPILWLCFYAVFL